MDGMGYGIYCHTWRALNKNGRVSIYWSSCHVEIWQYSATCCHHQPWTLQLGLFYMRIIHEGLGQWLTLSNNLHHHHHHHHHHHPRHHRHFLENKTETEQSSKTFKFLVKPRSWNILLLMAAQWIISPSSKGKLEERYYWSPDRKTPDFHIGNLPSVDM